MFADSERFGGILIALPNLNSFQKEPNLMNSNISALETDPLKDVLIATKLFIPSPQPKLVNRTRLTSQLTEGIHRKMTLISAPAGFGKSTLLSHWIANTEISAVWYSLDEDDNDPRRFLSYFCAAIQSLHVNFGEEILASLQSQKVLDIDSTMTSLLNQISGLQEPFALVLDDFHIIENKEIDQALTFLLKNMPPILHLIIATREDPNLPLSKLRARDRLTELREKDLRFTPDETEAFFNKMMNLNLSDENINALKLRTEGWATGLQLAAISMRGHDDISTFIESFTGSHRYILDYLTEEVLNQQPEHIQAFLLGTSILDRLSAPLCEAVLKCPEGDGKETLNYLEHANLFLVPLDDNRQWYRYHHLFADVLRARLMEKQPDQLNQLHSQASEWYEEEKQTPEAIKHALAARDYTRAANLAESSFPYVDVGIDSIYWLSWLKDLPEDEVRLRPLLCAGYAWANMNAGKLESADSYLLVAEKWLEDSSAYPEMVVMDNEQLLFLPFIVATARAYHLSAIGDVPATIKHCQKVMDLIPEDDKTTFGTVNALLGLAYWQNGDLTAAEDSFTSGLTNMSEAEIVTGTFVHAEMKLAMGELDEAIAICERAIDITERADKPTPMGIEDVYSVFAVLCCEKGQLDLAAKYLALAKTCGDKIDLPDWKSRWYVNQARLSEFQGDFENALRALDIAEKYFVRTPVPEIQPIASMRARIWIRQGLHLKVLNWAHARGIEYDQSPEYLHEHEYLTLVRALIARYREDGHKESIDQALNLLDRLITSAEAQNRYGSLIVILVTQTMALEAKNDTVQALTILERAVKLAEPQGYIGVFVDAGQEMQHLLEELSGPGKMPGYTTKLLSAFHKEDELNIALAEHSSPRSIQPMQEPLSRREREVLDLISEGLSNQEICKKLFVSLSTVKGHNLRIFAKLDVKRRTEAVARARELGIL